MKKILLPLFMICATALQAQLNIQFKGHLPYTGLTLANIGGYVDSLGNEYALVGYQSGLDIVDVTVPTNPVVKFTVPGGNSEWREVKTYRKYAYVTTEQCCDGLQIVDLSKLPDSIHYKTYTGDGAINTQIHTLHSLHIDTAKAFCYLYGSNISTNANTNGYPLIISLTDPWNPVYVGNFIAPSGSAYVHDGYVQNDTAYYCHIYDGFVSIVDESNKSAPVLLATQYTPGLFTHNSWLSDNHHVMFTTDEKPSTYVTAYDITNMSNLTELSRFQTDPGSNAIVHNVHILNDYAVTSWYTEGVVIVDESRPDNPVEVGHYNEYGVTSNGGTFHGDWGVYPFLPSHNLVVSDIDSGLWVLAPTYVRGCYLEGVVTDSVSGLALQDAQVQIISTPITRYSDISGNYKTGIATAGTYSIQVSKGCYYTKTITGITLNNGVVTTLNVQLNSSPTTISTTVCAGNSATLHANGSSVLEWFSSSTGGTAIDTGTTFITPALNSTTTYYVESDVNPTPLHIGPANNSFGGGGYFNANNYHDLIFDVYAPVNLVSVYVYANGAGQRIITLDSSGVTINSATVNLPNGGSRVTLNFPIQPGASYELGCQGTVNLYRNTGGSAYPYTINGLVSITGDNSGTTGYYYYFYDWIVIGPPCVSARVPVTATVAAPVAAFTSNIVAQTVSFTGSGGVSYFWDFGNPASGSNDTSTSANPTHVFSSIGSYQVCLIASNGGNGCSDTICKTVTITTSGISEKWEPSMISVYPNPFSKEIVISGLPITSKNLHLKFADLLGNVICEKTINTVSAGASYIWDLSFVPSGAYILTFENNGFSEARKLVKIE